MEKTLEEFVARLAYEFESHDLSGTETVTYAFIATLIERAMKRTKEEWIEKGISFYG